MGKTFDMNIHMEDNGPSAEDKRYVLSINKYILKESKNYNDIIDTLDSYLMDIIKDIKKNRIFE